MSDLVDVGKVEDFVEGRVQVVVTAGKEIAVLSWRGDWYALRNVCPHRGAPLCTSGGRVGPFVSDEPGPADLEVDWSRPTLMCPWHRWEFDLSTGFDVKRMDRVKTYPVEVRNGRVMLRLGQRRRRPEAP